MKISREELDALIRKVEARTCFRFSAGTVDGSLVFMTPVSADGYALGPAQKFTVKQLRALAKLSALRMASRV